LDELPNLSEEMIKRLQDLQGGIMKRAEYFRIQVHGRLNPQTLQTFATNEKSAIVGGAGGAILGFLL
jgi:hypothetical protein